MRRLILQIGGEGCAIHGEAQVDDPSREHHHDPDRAFAHQLQDGELRCAREDDEGHADCFCGG